MVKRFNVAAAHMCILLLWVTMYGYVISRSIVVRIHIFTYNYSYFAQNRSYLLIMICGISYLAGISNLAESYMLLTSFSVIVVSSHILSCFVIHDLYNDYYQVVSKCCELSSLCLCFWSIVDNLTQNYYSM